jgi:hypothetical protein
MGFLSVIFLVMLVLSVVNACTGQWVAAATLLVIALIASKFETDDAVIPCPMVQQFANLKQWIYDNLCWLNQNQALWQLNATRKEHGKNCWKCGGT